VPQQRKDAVDRVYTVAPMSEFRSPLLPASNCDIVSGSHPSRSVEIPVDRTGDPVRYRTDDTDGKFRTESPRDRHSSTWSHRRDRFYFQNRQGTGKNEIGKKMLPAYHSAPLSRQSLIRALSQWKAPD